MNAILSQYKDFFIKFFTKGHSRTLLAKKNIIASLLIKGLSIVISLIMIPITIHYINPSQYGIWLTLSSIVSWVSFFDIGFTQGFRNKFAEAKAVGNFKLAQSYVSTTYFYIAIIFVSLWLLLILVNQFINWNQLINVDSLSYQQIKQLVFIIFSYFCFQFVFKIINTIFIADQKPSIAALLDLIGQVISLIIVYTLTVFTNGSLLLLAVAVGAAPTIVYFIANLYFFKFNYKSFAPSFKSVKKEYASDILNLGVKFFVLQIAAIIQYQTILFLIAHYFNTLQVTAYNIAYKYFGIIQMVFIIFVTPLWSGVTDAYSTKDFDWIKNAVKKYLFIYIVLSVVGLLMLIVSNTVYNIWIGNNVVTIKFSISLLCYLSILTTTFGYIFVFVINGIGAIKIQFYSSIITPLIFIVLSLLMIKVFKMGVESILISSIASNVFGVIIAPLQYYKVFYKKSETPIWYK